MLTADDDLNTLTVGGHYLFFGNSIPQNAPTGLIDWTAYVIENLPYNELVTAQILHIIVPDLTYGYGKYSNCSLRRTRYGDTYTPWAWINPPMELGVEYMTTEHHLGKPVYCKLIDCGAVPDVNTNKTIGFSCPGISRIISWTGNVDIGGNTFALPYHEIGRKVNNASIYVFVNYTGITLRTDDQWFAENGGTAQCTIWYTKTVN